mmetsp:Transcript_26403/g.32017  ORF Transcript_26403/g.32017 Transcript_26403/m.32017 type:complete len:106 (+) Transcript_26403:840-1157(+)
MRQQQQITNQTSPLPLHLFQSSGESTGGSSSKSKKTSKAKKSSPSDWPDSKKLYPNLGPNSRASKLYVPKRESELLRENGGKFYAACKTDTVHDVAVKVNREDGL